MWLHAAHLGSAQNGSSQDGKTEGAHWLATCPDMSRHLQSLADLVRLPTELSGLCQGRSHSPFKRKRRASLLGTSLPQASCRSPLSKKASASRCTATWAHVQMRRERSYLGPELSMLSGSVVCPHDVGPSFSKARERSQAAWHLERINTNSTSLDCTLRPTILLTHQCQRNSNSNTTVLWATR